jgi:hypothetical protein
LGEARVTESFSQRCPAKSTACARLLTGLFVTDATSVQVPSAPLVESAETSSR